MLRVGIIGTSWGRTHVGTFRSAGCVVHAIVGRDPEKSRQVAEAEGVPHWDPVALAHVDLVVVATPIDTHAEWIRRFADRWVWCEKPLAVSADLDLARVGVNYAWPFLTAGPGAGARMRVAAGVGGVWACREVAVHPLSWVHHAVGPLSCGSVRAEGDVVRADLQAGAHPFELVVEPSAEGIDVDLDVGGKSLVARFRPAEGWTWQPDAGKARWYRANCEAAAAFVRWAEGGPPARPLFTGARAAEMERALGPLLGPR